MHLAIDLYCGLGGWAEGFMQEGYTVIGFDMERHDYGTGGYPGQLVLQDVLTLHGRQFRDATVIVASPPCQAYSYRAMPWKRAKALPPPDNSLFEACFRIQREACEASGRYIPLIVENVCGAQKWVGRAKWHYGSYYLWGDVPAIMPITFRAKVPNFRFDGSGKSFQSAAVKGIKGVPHRPTGYWTNANENGIKQGGEWWHDPESMTRKTWGTSRARKAASAMIAKIPLPLARWIARCYKSTPDPRYRQARELVAGGV